MKFAVNISKTALRLAREGRVNIDLLKCPAWPNLLRELDGRPPVYVHFPLRVGLGIRDAINTETRQPADWALVETLLGQTQTPYVNLHLAPRAGEFEDLSIDVTEPTSIERVTERLIRDVQAVVERFGRDHVIVESVYDHKGEYPHQALLPQVIRRVIEETGCGLLLDLSHARLAAFCLEMDPFGYLSALPLSRIREIHITGIQRFDGFWTDRLKQARIDSQTIQRFAGRLLDHLPMTPPDWEFFAWAMTQIHRGAWSRPSIVAYEYGGIDSWWEALTDEEILLNQLPRLVHLVRNGTKP